MDLAPGPTDTTKTFGEMLRNFRVAAGLTQEALANRTGLSPRGIGDLECGRRHWPHKETLRLLVAALALTGNDRTAFLHAAQRPTSPRRQQATVDSRGETAAAFRTAQFVASPLPFVGREEELRLVLRLLVGNETRLITLTGVGGCGKTRLALEVARQAAEGFPDGIFFADLAALRDRAGLLAAIAQVLDASPRGGQSTERTLIARLQRQRVLLVLDNCEQLLPLGPELGILLDACSGLTVLATSRERLNLRTEQEVQIPPLPFPDRAGNPSLAELRANPAVALFVHRAAMSHIGFALTTENAAAIAGICGRLDGLPLAIELAAPYVKAMSPAMLLKRLAYRLPLLVRGPVDAPDRQRTLHDTLRWSYDLLAPEEQTLFRRLAVFAGGWTLEAAEAIIEPVGALTLLDGLVSLIDKSLVRVTEHGAKSRFDMLETVREFALDQLRQAGDYPTTRDGHVAYFLAFAERTAIELANVDENLQFRDLEEEHANLREAFSIMEALGNDDGFVRLANALAEFWFGRSHAREGLRRLERALALQTEGDLARAKALIGAGSLAYACGEFAQAKRWLPEGEALARSLNEPTLLSWSLLVQGTVAEQLGDEAGAQAFFESGYTVAQQGGAMGTGVFLANLSDAAYRRGEIELADQYAREAMDLLQQPGDAYMKNLNLGNVAQVALARGNTGNATEAFSQALRIAIEIRSPLNVANAIAGAAAVSAALGHHAQAARFLGAAEAERERSGHLRLPHFHLCSQTQATVREHLDVGEFDAAWAAGYVLSEADAAAAIRAFFTAVAPGG